MKTLLLSAITATVLMFALPGSSLAQPVVRGGGSYDPQTVWTVSGEVLAIDEAARGQRGYFGVQVLLKTANGDLAVHLGPSWFVNRQTLKVVPHEVIEVTGSPVIYDGKPALIASRIRKGGESLRLRTTGGLPLWRQSAAR